MAARVIDALRRFLPRHMEGDPVLHEAQRRAVWAITHCRTAAMGGHLHACCRCRASHYLYHSCNHRACPQCGAADTAAWVERQLERRVDAPHFLVTFTLPAELRELFFGPEAKSAYDAFFAASSRALAGTLASPRWLGACESGFTGILHTWNQRLLFHPHVHYLVPGAGLDAEGRFVTVKNANFLVPIPVLSRRFRENFREQLDLRTRRVDPAVWTRSWGVHVQPVGDGAPAIGYLGAYVCRTAIADSRLVRLGEHDLSFTWKDRAHGGRLRTETIAGVEFARRYLRHVLPRGLRSIRHFGFCHPAAKRTAERVRFHSGRPLRIGPSPAPSPRTASSLPLCPGCGQAMPRVASIAKAWSRGPPVPT